MISAVCVCLLCLAAVARRLQAVQDGVCLPAHRTGALPAQQVGVTAPRPH